MNIWMQIGLGLIPGSVAALLFMLRRKAFLPSKIFAMLILLGVNGFCGVQGFKHMQDGQTEVASLSGKEMMEMANALYEEEAYDEAKEVLSDYSETYGYDDECRLLNARIALASQDYVKADGLYQYLVKNTKLVSDKDDEVQFARDQVKYDASDLAMIHYLENEGEDLTDYGYAKDSSDRITEAMETELPDVLKKVSKQIKKRYSFKTKGVEDCARAVKLVAEKDEEGGNYKKAAKIFREIAQDNPKLLALLPVKKAEISANIQKGDYEKCVSGLSDNADYHELLVAAELYVNDVVDDGDFPDSYKKIDSGRAAAVKEQLDKVADNQTKNMTKQEKKKFEARIDGVKQQLKDPVVATLKEKLNDAAQNDAGTDASKVYLELAKIEGYCKNQTSMKKDLSEAIYGSQDCEDDAYVNAMGEIISVINSDEVSEAEKIKNVPQYVETVLDHSTTVDIGNVVSKDSEFASEFQQTTSDYVSQAKSAVTIGKIDTEDFEKITARVKLSSDYLTDENALKAALEVYDCGAKIENFTLKKLDFKGSNILLCCDVSGSMSGNMQDLRDAVATFVNEKNKNEDLAVVTFDDGIVDVKDFGTSDKELLSFAESLQSLGGTNMFDAVLESMDKFDYSKTENNILILMTDGQDNSPRDAEEIYEKIGKEADNLGVTIYTLGLGSSVDTNYLTTIANSGYGSFVYVSDSSSLTGFYDMLHEQLYDQYELTYTAMDTLTVADRTLEVTIPSENTRDNKYYDLDSDAKGGDALADLSIQGLMPNCIVKGGQSYEVSLKGTGFKKTDSVTVKLNGNIDYTLETSYVDSETIKLTVPSTIAIDSYNAEITINGKKKVLQNGFEVTDGTVQTLAFGPYVFTASKIIDNGNQNYSLIGNVQMNSWLHFRGGLTIEGDYEEGSSIRVNDQYGSYVVYDKATASGLAKTLAEKGISLSVPALYQFNLYNDQKHRFDYENYQVDDISTGFLMLYQMMRFDAPIVRLYPDSIGLYIKTGTTILPYQDEILKACGRDNDIFDFDLDASAQLTDKQVGLVAKVHAGDADESNFNRTANLFNSKIYFNGSVDADINTLKNEYKLGAMVRLAFFAKESGVGFEVGWKGGLLNIDSAKFSLSLARGIKLPTAIPIEANDFSFMVSDIQTAVETHNWAGIKFTGTTTLSSGKVKDYFPALEKYIGDISVLEMPDTSATLRIWPTLAEAEAQLNLFKEITIAKAKVSLGVFDYTNELLDLDGTEVAGVSAALTQGLMWETAGGRLKIDISGTTEADLHTRFLGVYNTGTCGYDVKWWLINSEKKLDGQAAVGIYKTHDDLWEFVFAMKYNDGNKVKGFFYYIDQNGHCGKNNGVLS